MRLLPLIAATYFMVSGGPYGIEDILGGAGYGWAIAILLVLPFLWSLPTALMIGELASAIPAEGGFYVWVRRALGPFWGYQESWLSLSASIFDMALYPSIFVLYLGKFSPALTAGWRGYAWSLAVVAVCSLWNLRGAPAVGEGSIWLFVLLLSPFAVFVALGFWRGFTAAPRNPMEQRLRDLRNRIRRRLRLLNCCSGGHVELHGLGQRIHRRAGGGESAAQLSARHDRGRRPHRHHLYSAAAGHGARRALLRQLLHRRLGPRRPRSRRARACWNRPRNRRRCRRLHHRHRHVQRAGP